MKKTFACLPLLIFFGWVGTTNGYARTFRITRVQSIHWNRNLRQVIDLRSLVRDGHTYLGIIAERSRKHPLQAVYRIVRLDQQGHSVESGPPFPGPLNLNNDIVEEMAAGDAPTRYPRVVVRDRLAKTCPYLLVTPLTLRCVQRDLSLSSPASRAPATTLVPFNIRGVHVMNGAVWIEGIYHGTLAQRWDPETGQIVGHALSLAPLVKFLQRADDPQAKTFLSLLEKIKDPFPDLQTFHTQLKQMREKRSASSTSHQTESIDSGMNPMFRNELAASRLVPPTLSFDWIVIGKEAYVFFLGAMAVAHLSWPEGTVKNILYLSKAPLPPKLTSAPWVYLYDLTDDRSRPMVWLQLDYPLTYQRARLVLPPKLLKGLEHFLERKHRLYPDTIVGMDSRLVGLRLPDDDPESVTVHWIPRRLDHRYTMDKVFFLTPTDHRILMVDEDYVRFSLGSIATDD